MRLAKRRRVGPDDPMAVVHRFLDAANHHDSDTLYATVHPEFESFQPLHPDRDFRGPGQLISNWKAIFEAEPGFRLTVLRASTTGNTVWVELHGAGDSAEAAGIFIVGVENGRIRWVRVYSDLVEAAPEVDLPDSAGQPGDVTAEPSTPSFVYASDIIERPAGDGARPVPATLGQADDGGDDSGSLGSGALRLVEGSDEPEPETASEPAPPPDPGLRLVDPSATEAGTVGEGPESDAGPVETLVGPSRSFPTPSPADEATPIGASLADLWSDKDGGGDAPTPDPALADLRRDSSDDPAGKTDDATGVADDADADHGGDESAVEPDPETTTDESPPDDLGGDPDTDADPGTDADVDPGTDADAESEFFASAGSAPATATATEEPSTIDDKRDPPDPPAPRTPDAGRSHDEPRLSRWRKALRKY